MTKSDKVRHQIRVAKRIWKNLDLKLLEALRSLLQKSRYYQGGASYRCSRADGTSRMPVC